MESLAEVPPVGGADDATAHFCKPPSEEEVETWRRHWRAEYDAVHPQLPPSPMGNLVLALDLSGDGIREYEFHGVTYRLHPTPYRTALVLIGIRDRLNTLAAIGEVTGEEQLVELRDCYVTIATFAGELLTPREKVNPFLEDGEQVDLHQLLLFLMDSGDTMPRWPSDGQPLRVDAAHELMAYRAVYGEPTTWRAFQAGSACIAQQNAERSLDLYFVVTVAGWGTKEGREELESALKRAAGR